MWVALALMLGGCAGRPPLPEGPVDPKLRQQALLALPGWEARGRIAVRAEGTGGQASFVWGQQGDDTALRVSGPFGAGAYEIAWSPTEFTLRSARGESRLAYAGPDAAGRFLADELGWSWPVASVRYWLLGLAGPSTPAEELRDAQGRLTLLSQDGWQVNYQDYRPQGGWWLPRKLEMENDAARIRVIIDAWAL